MSRMDSLWAFIRNVGATITASGLLFGLLWFLVGPRVIELVQEEVGITELSEVLTGLRDDFASIEAGIGKRQATMATLSDTQAQMATTLSSVVGRIADMEKRQQLDDDPPIVIAPRGNIVSDGEIGGYVEQTWAFHKSRGDCGRPRATVSFINGGGRVHQFRDVSIVGEGNFAAPAPVTDDLQRLSFVARIPEGDGVLPTDGGENAYAFVVVDWPEQCPHVPPAHSPYVPFEIRETEKEAHDDD